MRKNFRMYLTLALVMLGVMSVNAQELVSLQEVPFTTWVGGADGYGKDATAGEAIEVGSEACPFVLNEPTGQPYGDSGVINGADLSLYSKLIVTYTEGTPRILMNRDVYNGQCADNQLIDNTVSGDWSKYFTDDGSTIIVDLKQMLKDRGYVRLHAIKGANWANVTVTSMMLERASKAQQVGWVNLINNSDMEGDDVSSFFTKVSQGAPEPSVITDGIGVDGSRGIKVEATAKVAEEYDNQFWFRFNEPLPAGTKYRVSFDYRADQPAAVGTQAHAEPSDYIYWQLWDDINFDSQWQTFTREGEVTADQSTSEKQFLSAAFNLNKLADANNYYFDNIKFEVYKYGTTAEYDMDVIKLDFGFDTNSADLVKATGKPRLVYPEGCATVKVDGEEMAILSVEAFADGRFFIFTEDILDEDAEVEVSFTNPTDPAYHLIYTSGPGGDVANVNVIATNNSDVPNEDGAYAYIFETPVIVKAEPEAGSFNLPNSISEFKITFDKEVDCAKLVAKLNNETLTVIPAEGFAEEVTLTRTGGDLATGEYKLTIDKVYPEIPLDESIYGTYTITLNVGKVELDPSDVYELVMTDDFANGGAGWWVNGDGNWQEANSGSGCRIITGGANAGQGFTPSILYMGSRADGVNGTATFGNREEKLTLKAKTYHLSFGAARWDSGSATLKAQIFSANAVDENGNAYADPIAEESKAIEFDYKSSTGATKFDIVFNAPEAGNYVLKFITGNSNGEPVTWGDAIALGDVKVEYIPNTAGAEETRQLNDALAKAKEARDAASDERYAGEAFTALDEAIKTYEAEKDGYTAPSQYANAVKDLTALTEAMNTHRGNCDTYDQNRDKAIDLVTQYAETKFNKAAEYAKLAEVAAKYEGKVLTNDDELIVAIAELTDIVNLTSYVFTEGESQTGTEGIAALVERIRLGAEALKSLGVSEDDELIVAANNTLTDDDSVAEAIKNRLTEIVYGNMKEANSNGMFNPVVDDETLEETTPMYDMTVFVKNPNIYSLHAYKAYTEEDVPGWVVPTGNGEVNTMWAQNGSPHQIEGLACDVAFTKYHQNMRVEQTIGDLPAGVYTVVIDAVSWADDDTTDGYAFIKTSDTPAAEEGEEEQFAQKIDLAYWGQYQGHHDNVFDPIVVTDGILTLGVNFGPNSQYEFDKVKVYLSAPANGVDYAGLYNEFVTGVEGTTAQPATVKAIELYNLDGRRISTARQGIVIVKKVMSDGTVRTEKVVKK